MAYTKFGKMVAPASDHGHEIPLIPTAVYILEFHPMRGFYLTEQDALVFPDKTYGSVTARAERILHTYGDRPDSNTGVLLSGNKGSGKTMLSKMVSMKALEQDLPVIILDQMFAGPAFTQFMNSITQRCVVLIDEFEKKYKDAEAQNSLLSLLDGTGTTGKLYLLTSNSALISEFLISRPSRIFYHYKYTKLDKETVVGYCTDNLKDYKHIDNMLTLWTISLDMSFDVMQCLVEDLNRYPDCSFFETFTTLNITLGSATQRYFKCHKVMLDGKPLEFHETRDRIDVLTFPEGARPINTTLRNIDWDLQKELKKFFGRDCQFYNYGDLAAEEKGEEVDINEIDDNIGIGLRFDGSNTAATTDTVRFTRDVNGKELVIVWNAEDKAPELTFLEKLFV